MVATAANVRQLRHRMQRSVDAVGELKKLQAAVQELCGIDTPAPGIGPTLDEWMGWAALRTIKKRLQESQPVFATELLAALDLPPGSSWETVMAAIGELRRLVGRP